MRNSYENTAHVTLQIIFVHKVQTAKEHDICRNI